MSIAGPQIASTAPVWVWTIMFYGGLGAAVWFAYMGVLDAIMYRKDAAKRVRWKTYFIKPPRD